MKRTMWRLTTIAETSLIYLKRNVTLSTRIPNNCNKRTIIETIRPASGQCGKDDITRRWYIRRSSASNKNCSYNSSFDLSYVSIGNPTRSFCTVGSPGDKSTVKKGSVQGKKVQKIKRLHVENKHLFGKLLETKSEKVKRTKAEVKSIKRIKGLPGAVQNENFDEPQVVNSGIDDAKLVPRSASVRLEHAAMSINKNRKRDAGQDKRSIEKTVAAAHKGAEIKWALRNAPTKMKLIELFPSSANARTDEGHTARVSLPENEGSSPGHDAASFTSIPHPSSHPESLSPADQADLPTVEQLINSFYETDDRQLRSTSKSRKVSNNSSNRKSSFNSPLQQNQEQSVQDKIFNEPSAQNLSNIYGNNSNKTDKNPATTTQPQNTTNSSQNSLELVFLPYYNATRGAGGNDEIYGNLANLESGSMNLSNDGSKPNAGSTIISFPYPFSSSRRNPVAETDNELITPLPKTTLKLPSVSKILNVTMPEEQAKALKRWEEKMIAQMGEHGFRQYKEGFLTNGKNLHKNIELLLRGTPLDEIKVADANQGHWNSLSAVLASIEQVHLLESHVHHPNLEYCGMVDCIAEFRNRLVLIDWKTSQKPKPLVAMTYDTPIQIAAYVGAINYDPKYSFKIDDGLIVVAYEDGSSCQTFLLKSVDIEKYWKLWLQRLQRFRQINPLI